MASSSSRRTKAVGGDSIGQFVIDQEIGKGSFAQVYAGKHKVTGALVAIKSVEIAKLNKKLKENLYGEIKILKTLRHPHIVALHDCVESATHINLIMEYCDLGDLSMFIKKREKLITNPATHDIARKYPNAPNSGLNEVVTRHFLKQLASALKFLREGNFVHRDVKPQNLLLLPSPQYREANKTLKHVLSASYDSMIPVAGLASLPMLKLADFGFARVLPSTSLAETLCGSPLYMAPEILRYQRYDAKADLWSVGTVLYEMVTGRPPFRANNHVELLRKIDMAADVIKFPRETIASREIKDLIRRLLMRSPLERMSFERFFDHEVVSDPIPGLVEDDIPKDERRSVKDIRAETKSEGPAPTPIRKSSFRKHTSDFDGGREGSAPNSPRPRHSSPLATPIEAKPNPLEQVPIATGSYSPRNEGLGIRPRPQPSTSAPTRPPMYTKREHRSSNVSLRNVIRETPSQESAQAESSPGHGRTRTESAASDAREKAAQEIAFERDYVVVEKRQVEVNAFADELDANRRLAEQRRAAPPSNPGQLVRRATQQGSPTSLTGAVAAAPSRGTQLAQGKIDHHRAGSYDKNVTGTSPGSGPSSITKAIQDASLRLFGFKYPPQVFGKGASPPQLYSPFPAYPTPPAPIGLIGDGKQSAPVDEDARVAQCIDDYAHRSDVVYGFAEVKYKQLVPLAPSMEHGLGGLSAEKMSSDDDLGLTVEAIVCLSEEALLLYVKALSLLAKSMDIASLWWSRKSRSESANSGHGSSRDSMSGRDVAVRINAVVQWIRSRFNEVLEKALIVRLKLIEAQKQLPEDHASHPANQSTEASVTGGSSTDGVFLTPGMSAEKLMYERAVEMSRAAAINEISNDDLPGCERSYVTAIRMLEAVLDSDDDLPKRRSVSGSAMDEKILAMREDMASDLNGDDKEAVQKVMQMVTGRLSTVRKKMRMIEAASKGQQQQQLLVRRRSGDVTPRSVPT